LKEARKKYVNIFWRLDMNIFHFFLSRFFLERNRRRNR
jgi:hypothetical protein